MARTCDDEPCPICRATVPYGKSDQYKGMKIISATYNEKTELYTRVWVCRSDVCGFKLTETNVENLAPMKRRR